MILFRDIAKLEPGDLGWLSGKLDSHAVFLAPPLNRKTPAVIFRNKSEDVVKRVAQLIGYNYRRTRKAADRCEIFEVQVRGNRAVWIMKQVHPHLMRRQGQRVFSILNRIGLSPVCD